MMGGYGRDEIGGAVEVEMGRRGARDEVDVGARREWTPVAKKM